MFNLKKKMKRLGSLASGSSARTALTGAAFLLAASAAHAVPQIMTDYGDQVGWVSAESNAMGATGTSVYHGAISNIFNPAYLVMEKDFRLDASVSLDQQHEDRFQPLFDSFDSFVVDAAIASNRNHYWQTGFGFAASLDKIGLPIAAGISLADRYAFGYTFEEELLNPSPFPPGSGEPARDALIEERARNIDGTIRDLSLGLAADVFNRVSVGASVHYAYGDRNETNSVRDYIPTDGDDSYTATNNVSYDGVNFTLGARVVLSERVELGVAWESALEVSGDREMTLNDAAGSVVVNDEHTITYPNMFRVGLTFMPRTDPRTVFTIEAEYKPWSELEDSDFADPGSVQNLNDVTDVKVGLEHTFYNGIPLRFGFRHVDTYADRDADVSVFSTGVGAPIGGGMVSVSVELSKISAVMPHQFPYPDDSFGDNFRSDPFARVDDTRFRIGVGYKVVF